MTYAVKSRSGVDPAFTGTALTPGEFNRIDLAFQFPPAFLQGRDGIARTQAFLAPNRCWAKTC